MARFFSKSLVIDADVARRSGEVASGSHPSAKACREFLQSVLSICHRLVISNPLRAEWDQHQGSYFRRWRTEMVSKSKVVVVDDSTDQELRASVLDTAKSGRDREEMEKDLHLLEAALKTDKRVISADEKARKLFKRASRSEKKLNRLFG